MGFFDRFKKNKNVQNDDGLNEVYFNDGKSDPSAYTIPSFNTLGQGGSYIFYASTMGIGINNSGEIIYLKDPFGQTVDTWNN